MERWLNMQIASSASRCFRYWWKFFACHLKVKDLTMQDNPET